MRSGPLRAHLLCCRSFGPAGVWLGARWLGWRPRQSTQVSHGSIALTGPIEERQGTGVRAKASCKAPSGAHTRGAFTWKQSQRLWVSLRWPTVRRLTHGRHVKTLARTQSCRRPLGHERHFLISGSWNSSEASTAAMKPLSQTSEMKT